MINGRSKFTARKLGRTMAAASVWALLAVQANAAPDWDTTIARGRTTQIDFTVSEGTGMSVDISPDGGWLVFDLLAHVYRVPAAGGQAEALTQASGVALNYHPRYSPDGRTIAFISDRGGQANLWVMDADGKAPRQVLESGDSTFTEPTWSADGKFVYLIRQHPHALGAWTRTNRLVKVSIDDGRSEVLAGTDQDLVFGPSASPDGRYLYYHRSSAPVTAEGYFKTPTDHQIRRVELATGRDEPVDISAQRRYYHREPFSDFAPRLSPDGRRLAFQRRVPAGRTEHNGVAIDQQTGLWLRDLSSGEERLAIDRMSPDQLETHTLYQIRLAPGYGWAADSKSIVYSEGGRLKRAWLDTGLIETIAFSAPVHRTLSERVHPRQSISDEATQVRALRWPTRSAKTGAVVFEAAGALWTKKTGEEAASRLLDEQTRAAVGEVELSPAWSPDGRWIAFATWSDFEGGHLWKVAAGGGKPVRLTSVAGEYLNPSWSADGRQIVVAKGAGGGLRGEGTGAGGWSDLVSISASGGGARTLARVVSDGGFARPSFGRDGRVYFASSLEPADRTAGVRSGSGLRSVSAMGGDRKTHAYLPAGARASISADGRGVALEVGDNLFVASLPSTSADAITVTLEEGPNAARRATTRGASFASWNGTQVIYAQGSRLNSFDPATGQTSQQEAGLAIARDVAQGDLLLTNARILTMRDRAVVEKGSILIRNGRIAGVGQVAPIRGAQVIDLEGKVVMPGLIDIHAHHLSGEDSEIIPLRRARSANYLAYGVTTTFDPAAPTSSAFAVAELTKAGKLVGPRVFSTGTPLYGAGELLLKSEAFAADTAARLAGVGALGLKQYYQPRRAQRQWAVQAARQRGDLLVTGEGMDLAYDLGMIMDGQTAWEHPLLDLPLYEDVVQFVARSGAQYNPELITPGQGLYLIEHFMAEKDLSSDPKQQLWAPWKDLHRKVNFTQRPLSQYPAILSVQGVKDIVRAGGKVGVGGHGQDQGLGTHREIWTFAQALTPMEALESATIVNARYLGLDRDLGSIEVGKIADLLVLDADPLSDVRNTLSASKVMIDGKLYDAMTLDRLWPDKRPYGPRRWMMTHVTSTPRAQPGSKRP